MLLRALALTALLLLPLPLRGQSATRRLPILDMHLHAATLEVFGGGSPACVNEGREVHMLGIGRVPAGHSARGVLDALLHGRPAPETQDWGGPNAASPGDTATAALFFPPGEYVITCIV